MEEVLLGMNKVITSKTVRQTRIIIVHGDITEEEVDAIVNAANSQLKHGGGVAGAIVRKGGSVIQEESDRIVSIMGEVETGHAVITFAGNLKCKFVIHAVGPIWRGGNHGEDELLEKAVISSLEIANGYGLRSVSLPAISTGIFGFPKDRASRIIVKAIENWIRTHENTSLKEVRLCLYDEETLKIFLDAI